MAKITNGKQAAVGFEILGDGETVTLKAMDVEILFGNGTKRKIVVGKLSGEVLAQALAHGLKQKLGDAAAIARNTETGQSATVQDKIDAVMAVADRLESGQWNKTERGAGDKKTSLLVEALAQMTKKSPEDIRAMLADKTDEEKKAIRANPKVVAVIAKIELQRAQARAKDAGDDSDKLLAMLGV